MKTCIVIPNYNHPNINTLLLKLAPYNLLCIIVDDGSDDETKKELEKARTQFTWIHLLTLPHNQGKGAAVQAGFAYAAEQNYTHAIQIDADGQHDSAGIPKFLAAIEKNPHALIAGIPIYDQSIPKSRLYGRKITNFWVMLETLSSDIKDAMCGYRAYPLQKTLQIIQQYHVGKRMNFDIEIIVRWHWEWEKHNIISIHTKVIYPPAGVSNFRLWQDNLAISWLHTRLFFDMLKRARKIFMRKIENWKNGAAKKSQQRPQQQQHWVAFKERGSVLGMHTMMCLYKIFGRKISHLFLYPIVSYFYCFNHAAKIASQEYLSKLDISASALFKHFFSFAESIIDKFAVWNGDIHLKQIEFLNAALFRQQFAAKRGGLILTAHLGNMEIARALAKFEPDVKINVVLFMQNAKKISALLEKINSQFKFNVIGLDNFGPNLAIMLQEKVNAGEFIVIAADRTSITQPQRSIKAKFLDSMANFPEGPFILGGLLQCPIYFMLCLKQNREQNSDSFKIIFEEFAPNGIDIARACRIQQLQFYADKYAKLLEEYCRQYPLQWFNFFNFWR